MEHGVADKPRLLVTGASGFLGWNLCRRAVADWSVTGVVHTHPIQIPGVTLRQGDLSDHAFAERLIQDVNPDIVVHLAAVSQPNDCERFPEQSSKINVDLTLHLAGLCRKHATRFVFTSTDLVFDGTSGPYREENAPSPVNEYGRQKVRAESGILKHPEGVLVCRMPLMFGDPGPVAGNFLKSWVEAMNTGKELRLFTDEFRTPVSGTTAADGILCMIERKHEGIVHLGGKERISRYALGRAIARATGTESRAVLAPCSQKDVTMSAPRPPDVSLDSSRAFAMGYAPGSIDQEIALALGR